MNILKSKVTFFIFLSFLISTIISLNLVLKLDKYESDGNDHFIIKGDVEGIWYEGNKYKQDLIDNKSILESGSEVYRSYLPSRLIAFFSLIFNFDLIDKKDSHSKINLGFEKFYYLLIQSILFYFTVSQLYKYFLLRFDDEITIFNTILFLCFCPSIFFFNSSFHTESLFFSLQLILIIFLIKPSTSKIYSLLLGAIITLMFLQKTVSFLYIFIIIFYLFLYFRSKSIKPVLIILLVYIFALVSIGYANYKRVGIFYFMPTQGNEAIFHYLAKPILIKSQNISDNEAQEILDGDLQNWINKNNIENINEEKNRIKFLKYKKEYTLNLIKDNLAVALKIISWKSIQTGILSPQYLFYYHIKEQDLNIRPYYLLKDFYDFWMPIQLVYSLIIYLIIVLGFFSSLKNLNWKFNFFLTTSAVYMFCMLGWVGNSRYFSPSLIYLSFYFGYGIKFLINTKFSNKMKFFK
jgi:hypothetical protein